MSVASRLSCLAYRICKDGCICFLTAVYVIFFIRNTNAVMINNSFKQNFYGKKKEK